MRFKKALHWTLAAVLGVGCLIQFLPVVRENPPGGSDLLAPPEVKAILRASCYDCHSNETVWPWYSKVAPVSWLVANDVEEARDEFNFSEWNQYSPSHQAALLVRIIREVQKGQMPPWYYTIKHRAAKLTPSQRLTLETWAARAK